MGTAEGDKIKNFFIVAESYIKNENVVVVSHIRNKIDRFTGGTLQGTLFTRLGNVAVGGKQSIGRGTLKGISAKINFKGKTYELGANGKVTTGNSNELSKFATSIVN